MVILTFDNRLLFSTNDQVYMLDEIPSHEYASRNFDYKTPDMSPTKRKIPAIKHPWRSQTFWKYVNHSIPDSDRTA